MGAMDKTDATNKYAWVADQGDGTYKNPILYTDYSDPDVIRTDRGFFMVASSFCNTPAIPLLHSMDLVNWKVVNYIVDTIPFPEYDRPRHGCGVWAPSIRHHAGRYYVFFPMPDEGIFMCSAKDPFGKWSDPVAVLAGKGWIDPCPFWDEDGKAYLVNGFAKSRCGFKSILRISPMKADGTGLAGEGRDVFDGHDTQPTIEGPKLYKRNGWYYIFAPAGGVKAGWQTVLRSRDIYGPYEEKIVLLQGDTAVNGPHQGGWVTTQTGQDWFIHFQDVGNAGRIVHLQPMKWEKDWPVIGEDSGEGYGTPVLSWVKPEVGGTYPACTPEDSDAFDGERLGLQWQWNANYKKEWYSLSKEQKQLTLYARYDESPLCDVPNLLLQKWSASSFTATVKLHMDELQPGDIAGMISLGGVYTALAVEKTPKGRLLVQITGQWQKGEGKTVLAEVGSPVVIFKMVVEADGRVSFLYGEDEARLEPVGESVVMTPGRWVGVKDGLFIVNRSGESGGCLKADYYMLTEG
jgi:beta-xylosidase